MPDETLTLAAARAYATWYRLTCPVVATAPPWQLLDPATRALWEAIAQAVRNPVPHARGDAPASHSTR